MSATVTETATGSSSQGHISLNTSAPAPSLDAYDEEQVRLMEERCILVNEKDEAYGEESKKTCELSPSRYTECSQARTADRHRPSDDQHQQRPAPPCIFRLSLPTVRWPIVIAKARRRKDYLPEHVDKYVLLASVEHQGGAGGGESEWYVLLCISTEDVVVRYQLTRI